MTNRGIGVIQNRVFGAACCRDRPDAWSAVPEPRPGKLRRFVAGRKRTTVREEIPSGSPVRGFRRLPASMLDSMSGMQSSTWSALAPLAVSVAALLFTYIRWRQERRPKLLVRLYRERHPKASDDREGAYKGYAKVWIEIYNDGSRAAEDVTIRSTDFRPHRDNLPSTIAFTAAFIAPGEARRVLLGRDHDVRFPDPGLTPFEVVARCKGTRCRWNYTLVPSSVLS